MSTTTHPATTTKQKELKPSKVVAFVAAFAVLFLIRFAPLGGGLGTQGHVALAMLGFAIVLWVTEAVTYPVSAFLITAIMALMMGFSPDPKHPDHIFGTTAGLKMAMGGFASSSVVLVAAALMLAAAMKATGLHTRLALWVLKLSGNKASHVLIGTIVISTLLSFLVPSTAARAGAIIPILMGMIATFGMDKKSNLAAMLMIAATQATTIWSIAIKTGGAPNLVADGFITSSMGKTVTWGQWFLYGAPWALLMSVALYFIMRATIKPEMEELHGGSDSINQQLAELGPMSHPERRLIVVSAILLVLWATEGALHPIDASTVTLAAIAFLLLPKVGVYSWKKLQPMVNWGTLIVFAVGVSLGNVLLSTGAAKWLSETLFGPLGMDRWPMVATIAVVTLFAIIIHLGFASATALDSALIPVFIALAATLPVSNGGVGFVLVAHFAINFGFLLPIQTPQNMLAYGTESFNTKQFLKTGVPLTIVGYLLILLFSATYWQWVGLL